VSKKYVGSREWSTLPKIKLEQSIRDIPVIEWDRPNTFLTLGLRNTGKSTLTELLAVHHDKIVDLYGSKDNENLCWCRDSSPIDDILLVHGENTEIDSSWPSIPVNELSLKDIESYEGIVTCNSFFSSDEVKYEACTKILNNLYERFEWKKIIFVAMREAIDILYSRLNRGKGEKDIKIETMTFQRQLRHFGVSFGLDLLKWTGLDKEIRLLADYTIIKKVGWQELPGEIAWIGSYVRPDTFRYLNKNEMILLTSNGAIGYCTSPELKWHKEEGVDLLKELGIQIKHREAPEKSTQQKVGDKEHAEIIKKYDDTQSMLVVSNELSRSLSTISFHVSYHNEQIEELRYCPKCRRAQSVLETTQIHTTDRPISSDD